VLSSFDPNGASLLAMTQPALPCTPESVRWGSCEDRELSALVESPWALQRVSARVRSGLRHKSRHRHILGCPARFGDAGWPGARTATSARNLDDRREGGGWGWLADGKREGGRKRRPAPVTMRGGTVGTGGRRLWVSGADDRRRSGLGEGVRAWGRGVRDKAEGRRAKGLGRAG
jgi:hypothetical protein